MKIFKKVMFYVLSCTWGIILTIMGAVVALALLITGHKPHKFYNSVYFRVGDNWGGFEMGPFFIIDKQGDLPTKQHEAGHGIQNIVLGPLMPFVVSIPSATRWWLFWFNTQKQRYIFGSILSAVIGIIGLVGIILGAVFNLLFLIIIGGIFFAYAIFLVIWLMVFEIPKYTGYVDYYSAWFESGTHKFGASYIGAQRYTEDDGN